MSTEIAPEVIEQWSAAIPTEMSFAESLRTAWRAGVISESDMEARIAAHYTEALGLDEEAARRIAHDHARLLEAADALVLVFPTWWFGLPAILKGWIDRCFGPGVGFHHAEPKGGPIEPALTRLKHFLAFTTLGSPWWIDTLVMWQPVRRMLKIAIAKGCAPQARFAYRALHGADDVDEARAAAFEAAIRQTLAGLGKGRRAG